MAGNSRWPVYGRSLTDESIGPGSDLRACLPQRATLPLHIANRKYWGTLLNVLRGDFVWNYPAQRFCARNRELHVPEIRFGRDKLHSDILLAVASPVDRDNAALHRLRGVLVHQDQRLSHQDELFQLKQGAVPVHRLRLGLRAE